MGALGFSLLVFGYLIGTSVILIPVLGVSEQDMWIAGLLGWLIGLGYAFFLGMCKPLKGRHAIIRLILSSYSLFLAILVTRNMGAITKLTLLPETPQIVCNAAVVLISAYTAFQGREVICRIASLTILFFLLAEISLLALSIQIVQPEQLLPVFDHSAEIIIKEAIPFASFPFMEMIILFPLLNMVKNPKKSLLLGTFLAGAVLILTIVFVIMILPVSGIQSTVSPFFIVVDSLPQGNYVRTIVVLSWLLTGVLKLTVLQYIVVSQLKTAFGVNIKNSIIPAFIAISILSVAIFNNSLEMFEFAFNIYPLVAIPIQIGLLLYITIVGWFSNRTTST